MQRNLRASAAGEKNDDFDGLAVKLLTQEKGQPALENHFFILSAKYLM